MIKYRVFVCGFIYIFPNSYLTFLLEHCDDLWLFHILALQLCLCIGTFRLLYFDPFELKSIKLNHNFAKSYYTLSTINKHKQEETWKDYLFTNLSSVWNLTRCCMIFNLMISEEEKITSQSISYIQKETVVNFCQRNFGTTQEYFCSKLPREITFCVSKT